MHPEQWEPMVRPCSPRQSLHTPLPAPALATGLGLLGLHLGGRGLGPQVALPEVLADEVDGFPMGRRRGTFSRRRRLGSAPPHPAARPRLTCGCPAPASAQQ